MRPQLWLRARGSLAAFGLLSTTTILAAGASLAASASDAQDAPVTASVADHTLSFGQSALVRGRLSDGAAGVPVALEFAPRGTADWHPIASAVTGSGGAYRLSGKPDRSGALRVTTASPAVAPAASAVQPVVVRLAVRAGRLHDERLAGRFVGLHGSVAPGTSGRIVALQIKRGRGWHTIDRARTGNGGRYALRARTHEAGSWPARVRAAGDAVYAPATRSVGRLDAFRYAFVSYYGPGLYGQHLACGGTLTPGTLGVANKTLPCGTKVTLRYHGHTVRVPVVDRGPYVGGREYDLTAATKERLHFGSTGTVMASR